MTTPAKSCAVTPGEYQSGPDLFRKLNMPSSQTLKTKKKSAKDFLYNLSLLAGSVFFTLLFLELLFPRYLNKLPLMVSTGLDDGLRILAQTSKKSVFPKNYIALAGDSNAEGVGDWLVDELRVNRYGFTTFDYHSAHVLYRETGRDVVTFGSAGSGSLGGLAAKPVDHFLYLNSLRDFALEKPKELLVYFYEGNDLDNNIRDLNVYYSGKYDMNRLYETPYFQKFIAEIPRTTPLFEITSSLKHFFFIRFILKGLENGAREVEVGIRKAKIFFGKTGRDQISEDKVTPKGRKESTPEMINKVIVAGKEAFFSRHTHTPSMELTEEETRTALHVFEQALLYLKNFFEGTAIKIVYIPSPLSSYDLAPGQVSARSYWDRGNTFDSGFVTRRSQRLCREVEKIADANQAGFLDTRPFIRKAAKNEFLHGPKDWEHLNKKGNHVLANAIATAFYDEQNSHGTFGCDDAL